MNKKIFFVVLFLFLSLSSNKIFAIDYFYDNFTSKDSNKWYFYPNGGNIDIVDGNLSLSSNIDSFPYLINKDAELFTSENNFTLSVGFKYVSSGYMGDGISVGFTDKDGNFFEQFQIWRDNFHGAFLAYHDLNTSNYNLCSDIGSTNSSSDIVYTHLTLDNDWHQLSIERNGTGYKVYIDQEKNFDPVYVTPDNQCIPKNILLGNKYYGGGIDWNSLLISGINVDELDYIPTPTLVPTARPTSVPTQPLESKNVIIIVPGFGASWNSDAIVYGKSVLDSEWKMTPFVNNYDSLTKALETNGLKKDKDFYLWNYDWRRPVDEIVRNLNNFIKENIDSDEKVILIGHSLGGVISRVWAEDHSADSRLKKVITLGSPHLGSVDAYYAWNSGHPYNSAEVSSIALNTLLKLKSLGNVTQAETIKKYIPSVKDLLPTFNFATKDGVLLSNDQLKWKNDYLILKNNSAPDLGNNLKLFIGNGHETLNTISLKDNNYFDKILDLWPDGRIGKISTADGDGTVIVRSASYDKTGIVSLESEHGNIVSESINQIMTEVGLSQVSLVNKKQDLKNNLVVFVGSPVNYSVSCDNNVSVGETGGFVVMKNNGYKSCVINMNGIGNGLVHVVSGNTNDNDWSYWEKNISIGESINIRINPLNGQMTNDRNNILFLKSIIREDIKTLLGSNKNNKDLIEALKSLEKDQPKQVIVRMFGFRRSGLKEDLSQKIINNAKIWLSLVDRCNSTSAHGGFNKINAYKNLIDNLANKNGARNLTISRDLANKYKNIDNLLTVTSDSLRKNNFSNVCADNFVLFNYAKEILRSGWENQIQKWLLEDSDL